MERFHPNTFFTQTQYLVSIRHSPSIYRFHAGFCIYDSPGIFAIEKNYGQQSELRISRYPVPLAIIWCKKQDPRGSEDLADVCHRLPENRGFKGIEVRRREIFQRRVGP